MPGDFHDFDRDTDRIFKWAFKAWIVWAVLVVTFWVAVIVVVLHFLGKVW